jgi:sterol-4alpha-carboxylate 3-dehydrogenase (decarboxylating)
MSAAASNNEPAGPVLITGGCGFIGFHMTKHILQTEPGCSIHVVDIDTTRNILPGVDYHKVDITDASRLQNLIVQIKPRTVFHIACPDSMVVLPSRFQAVNVDGTRNLLSACAAAGTVRALVNTSTSSVVHDNVSDLVDAGEDLPVLRYPQQKRVYTLTKAVAEDLVLAANRASGDASMLTANLRPATVFGERDTICMGKIVATCRAGRGGVQIGPGDNEYDFLYVGNLVDAEMLTAKALLHAYGKPPPPHASRVDGESFNVTNDERILFWDFQRAISASIGLPVSKDKIKIVPPWVVLLVAFITEWTTWLRTFGTKQPPITREAVWLTTITRTLNGDKAKRVLGYKPKYTIREGLGIAGKWFIEKAEEEEEEEERKKTKKSK